jgi:hypothetical protein
MVGGARGRGAMQLDLPSLVQPGDEKAAASFWEGEAEERMQLRTRTLRTGRGT